MLSESVRDFGLEKLRPAAEQADADCAAPAALLAQANELGLTMVGVPEQLGGAMEERSAVTTVLMAESLARGDMGLAVACLAPAAVSTALSLWGDGDQQATYLHEFVSENVPAAALAVLEPRALFNPFKLGGRARKQGDDFVLDAVKSLVPRGADAELFIVAAELDGSGPALFVVESKATGIGVAPEPAMGIRAASTGTVTFEDVKLPKTALLGGGDPQVYADCVQLSRLGWCAVSGRAGQAVLDYVIPYVNERQAFGEPIANRQGVAFTVANIGIELEGMRLATYRAAAAIDQGKSFAREVGARRAAVLRARDGDRLRRRPAARRPRLRQGAPGRALVSRSSCGRRDGRSSVGLMINLEIPKKFACSSTRRIGGDRGVPRQLAQVRPRRAHVPQGARHARRMIDGMNDSGALAARVPAQSAAATTSEGRHRR